MQRRKFQENIVWVIAGIAFSIIHFSCEKVIDINLNKANPKYVIEGNLSDFPGECIVTVAQTVDFSDPLDCPSVDYVIDTIQQDERAPVTLFQISRWIYVTGILQAKSLAAYKLSVLVDGQVFASTINWSKKVPFD